ncbi:MAG TPA: transglutaminase domain-containing protein, partial [Agromyces sp.]|nr:transglutaminase domain-containing protein [Agromyces sp.]
MTRRMSRTALADLGILSVLSLLGIAGYETSFGGLDFLLAAVAGLAVGTLAAVLGTLWRLNVVTTVLLGVALYFVVGTPFVMPDAALFVVLPSPTSLAGLAVGAVHGWADILTIAAPVEAPAYVAAVPYAAATVVSLVGGLLILRRLAVRRTTLRAAVALVGPVVLLLSGILLGTDEAFLAAVRGVAFAAIALAWVAWRRGAQVEASGEGAARLRRR